MTILHYTKSITINFLIFCINFDTFSFPEMNFYIFLQEKQKGEALCQ
ncbi:unnamed protein product, partial [Vitis vinifera]|uniref:Uncharacterized protein n=1 Tax=Vitis vinifera TaxID=29760 RepID=D7T3Z1_VITVI